MRTNNESPTIILSGPQAIGKTRHAREIARGFGCRQIIDDWNGRSALPSGVLAITCAEQYTIPTGAISLSVADEAGIASLLSLLQRQPALTPTSA